MMYSYHNKNDEQIWVFDNYTTEMWKFLIDNYPADDAMSSSTGYKYSVVYQSDSMRILEGNGWELHIQYEDDLRVLVVKSEALLTMLILTMGEHM